MNSPCLQRDPNYAAACAPLWLGLLVFVFRCFLGIFSAAASHCEPERQMEAVKLQRFIVTACTGPRLCPLSSAAAGIHHGKTTHFMVLICSL